MQFGTDGPLTPQELGARLSAERRARGLSQDVVAQHLGLSRPTVVAMEKGTRAVRPEEWLRIAAVLGCDVHDLVGRRVTLPSFEPQFRVSQTEKLDSAAIRDAVALFQRVCEDYVTLEEVTGTRTPLTRYPAEYSLGGLAPAAAAEETAALERSRLGLGQRPVDDLFDVLEDAGIRLFVLPVEEFRIAGMFFFSDRLGGCILVNGKHPATRQLWSAAHEYAHFLVDRSRAEVSLLVVRERKPSSEQFADHFAASFLMPAPGLRQRFRAVVRARGDFTVSGLCAEAAHYGVSVEAMSLRLERLGCIASGSWQRLSSDGFQPTRLQRSLQLPVPVAERQRLPERYVRLAVEAYSGDRITEGDLARYLRCSRVEAREIVQARTASDEVDDQTGQPYQLRLDFDETLELAAAERG